MNLENARNRDRFFTRLSDRAPLPESMNQRWMDVRAWLRENDPEYIWGN